MQVLLSPRLLFMISVPTASLYRITKLSSLGSTVCQAASAALPSSFFSSSSYSWLFPDERNVREDLPPCFPRERGTEGLQGSLQNRAAQVLLSADGCLNSLDSVAVHCVLLHLTNHVCCRCHDFLEVVCHGSTGFPHWDLGGCFYEG